MKDSNIITLNDYSTVTLLFWTEIPPHWTSVLSALFFLFWRVLCSCQLAAYSFHLILFVLCSLSFLLFCLSLSSARRCLQSTLPLNVIEFQKKFKECNLPTAQFFKVLFMQECYFYKSLPLTPLPLLHTTFLFPWFHYHEHPLKRKCVCIQQTRDKTEEN